MSIKKMFKQLAVECENELKAFIYPQKPKSIWDR